VVGQFIRLPYFLNRIRSRLMVVGSWGDVVRVQAGVAGQDDLKFIGWVQVKGEAAAPASLQESCLGHLEQLENLLHLYAADIVMLTQREVLSNATITGIMKSCENEHVQFKMVPQYFEVLVSGLRPSVIGGLPVLGMESLPLDKLSNRFKKRLLDIAGAVVGLVVFSPVIAIFATLVYLESPGPVFYRQVRTGQKGRPFRIIKIRSMRLDAEVAGAQWAQEDDPRRLRIGAFMRRWNIDETPQFWNVLVGEMSLVGPRPERPGLIAGFKHKIPHYNARHMYPPGITGWAQVNGWRGNTSLEERIRHDIWYMEHWSLWLDFRIMVQTFYKQKNAY
jgi:exopolysaccharide biosynthesis polyprenyl glycosylphosphotransferase